MKPKLKLILPNKKYALSYLKMQKEFIAEKNDTASTGMDLFKTLRDFPIYNKRMIQNMKGVNLPKNRVPSTLYWAVVGNKVVGRLDIRHRLSKHLRTIGGNIGYSVMPSERRKGYGTEMLRLGLQKAKRLGVSQVLITCNDDNTGSAKIIEKNGGVLENKIKGEYEGEVVKLKRRYWIKNK